MGFESIWCVLLRTLLRVLCASRGGRSIIDVSMKVYSWQATQEGVATQILSSSKGKSVIPSKDIFQLAGEGPGGRRDGRKGRHWGQRDLSKGTTCWWSMSWW